MLALKMIPKDVMRECREKARDLMAQEIPVNKAAAAIIIGIWAMLAALFVFAIVRIL